MPRNRREFIGVLPVSGVLATLFVFLGSLFLVSDADAQSPSPPPATERKFVAIPPDKDKDLKLYLGDARIVTGSQALERMQADADVILWLAGNQFFAMDDVIAVFQKAHPGTKVGLITLPPGLLLAAIQNGGWNYSGTEFPGAPDIYASVNLGHLKQMKTKALMETFAIYMHNELQIMVAKGNPKKIIGMKDLARADIRTSMPNPINEGIMQFYARKVLERHGICQTISGGKECFSCQTTERNWFTAVHHRETPERIRDDNLMRASSGRLRCWKPSARVLRLMR